MKKTREYHGLSGHPLYRVWSQMIQRCTNGKDPKFPLYGARGITVCRRWRESFVLFFLDMGERPLGASLDRVNTNKGYSPENCRWASPFEQAQNKRTYRNNSSGTSGVTWMPKQRLWYAHIRDRGVRTGAYFKVESDAKAWRAAALQRRGQ